MKHRHLIPLFILIVSLFPLKALATTFDVLVGFSIFPPWQIVRDEKFIGGIDKVVLEALRKDLQANYDIELRYQYYRCPLKRCLAALENGKLDLKTGLLKRPEREKYLTFIEPAYQKYTNKAVYLKKGSLIRDVMTYKDLSSLAVGVTRASKNFPQFDQDTTAHKIKTNGTLNGLKMLAAGRFDAFLGTELVADYLISHRKLDHILHKATFKHQQLNPGYIAISHHSPLMKVLPQIKASMSRVVAGQSVKDVIDQITFQP